MFPLRCFTLLAVVVFTAGTTSASVVGFDDIQYWVGNGSNEAAFVVDWNDGKDAWVWGYRWDGVATGADMIEDLVKTDSRLYAKLWQFDPSLGQAVIGLGVDRDSDGFAAAQPGESPIPFPADGYFLDTRDSSEPDGAVATDPEDSYGEGWWNGYWSYWIATGNPYGGGSWGYSGTGASGRQLTDGDWDGWSFLPGFMGDAPRPAVAAPVPAAVPEPSSLLLLGFVGGGGLVMQRLRGRRRSAPTSGTAK